jgi:hypothetical protein
MRKTPLIAVVLAGLALGVWACPDTSRAQNFTFAVLGDRTGGATEGVFEQVIADVEFLSPDLVLTVGDHIEGYLPDSAGIEAEWEYVVGLLESLGIEYHLTPGNHDIWDAQSRRIYARRFGPPDTAFVYNDNLFIILDVSTHYKADNLPVERIRWLEDTLQRETGYANVFVFYHKPFWCEDFSFQRPNLLHDIFRRYEVDAVFTGHYHRHFYTERDGIRYFGISSSGGSLPYGGRGKGSFYSYLLVRIEAEDMEVRVLEPGIGSEPSQITMEDMMRVASIESAALEMEEIRLAGLELQGTAKVSISIDNPGSSTLKDTARWVSTGDWIAEPLKDYVEVPPGETGTITAYLRNQGRLFPTPQLELSIAYDGRVPVELARPLPVKRMIHAVSLSRTPEIDGRLEDIWQMTGPETGFFGSAPWESPADSTSLRICNDGDYLYVAVECFESDTSGIQASVETRDGFGGYDDYILVLFEPEIGSDVFYQVAVNPVGTVFDKHIEICPFGTYVQDYAWDAPVDVATLVHDDRWVVEFRIPFETLDPGAAERKEWGFNFRRRHKRLGAVTDFQVPLWFDSDRLGLLIFQE